MAIHPIGSAFNRPWYQGRRGLNGASEGHAEPGIPTSRASRLLPQRNILHPFLRRALLRRGRCGAPDACSTSSRQDHCLFSPLSLCLWTDRSTCLESHSCRTCGVSTRESGIVFAACASVGRTEESPTSLVSWVFCTSERCPRSRGASSSRSSASVIGPHYCNVEANWEGCLPLG